MCIRDSLFGNNGNVAVAACYILTVLFWSLAGWLTGMSVLYAIGMIAICCQFGFQVWRVDLDRPEVNHKLFLGNVVIAVMLVIAVSLGTF